MNDWDERWSWCGSFFVEKVRVCCWNAYHKYVYMCIYMIQIFVFDVESIFSSKRIAISASYCRVTVWKNMTPLVFEIQSPLQRRCYPMLWSFRVWRPGNGVCHFPPSLIGSRHPSNGYVQNTEYCTYFLRNFRNLTSRACSLQLCRYQSRSFWTSKDTDPQQYVSNKPQAQDQNPDFWWVFSIFYLQKKRERKRNKNKIAWFFVANCCQLFRLQISILPDLYRFICCLWSHALDLFRTTAATMGFFVNTPGNQKLAAEVEFPDFMFKKKTDLDDVGGWILKQAI